MSEGDGPCVNTVTSRVTAGRVYQFHYGGLGLQSGAGGLLGRYSRPPAPGHRPSAVYRTSAVAPP